MGLQVSGGMSAAERARLLSVESAHAYTGTAVPTASVPDGSTYSRVDANGQWIEEYIRAGGAWVLLAGAAPFAQVSGLNSALASSTSLTVADLTTTIESNGITVDLSGNQLVIVRPGVYAVSGGVSFQTSSSTGVRKFQLMKFSGGGSRIGGNYVPGVASASFPLSAYTEERFGVGDTIYAEVAQSSGSAMDVTLSKLTARWVKS